MGPFANLAVGSLPGGCGYGRQRHIAVSAIGLDARMAVRPARTSHARRPGRRAVEAELRGVEPRQICARVDLQVLAAGVGGNGAAGMGDSGDWAACRAMAVGPLLIWWVALSASWRSRRVVHRRS